MSAPAKTDRSSALQVVLTILALGAGGLLLLLILLAAVGAYLSARPEGGMDPTAGLAVGRPAPAIKAEGWVNGEPPSLDGKVTVVQGWFYDCPYCWKEAPELASLYDKYGDRVAFVGLTFDPPQTRPQVEEFVSKNKLKYPVGYGAMETLREFEANAFPVVWVLGPDGKVVWNRSLEGKQSLEEAIEAALKGKTT
jgi:thiol-disulfide isomerase/thioredoxin